MSAPALLVRRPGLFTSIQDGGRVGYADVGVTPSGALNPIAMRLANALVGNEAGCAGLEIVHAGPELEIATPTVRVALVGAEPQGSLTLGQAEKISFPANRSVTLHAGDRLSIDRLQGSATCFLAIAGGFDLPEVLGSLATYARASMGGLDGRALMAGDALPLLVPTPKGTDLAFASDPDTLFDDGPLRVVLGPQDDAFNPDAIKTFLSQPYTIGRDSDRMGLRLEGPELPHAGAYEIPSDGIAPGSIQVPGTRLPIILLAERGTVGGYTKIATIISADLPRLGRVRPGDALHFAAVSRSEAEALRRSQEASIRALIGGMISAPMLGSPDLSLLDGVNLISGVWGGDGGSTA